MWRGGERSSAERATALLEAGQQAHAGGRLGEAEQYLREAAGIGRRLAELHPEAQYIACAVGSTLYSLGGVIRDQRRSAEAVDVLGEAEAAYLRAARLPPVGDVVHIDLRLADVRLRRAMVLARIGAGASAVADAQFAVLAYADAGRQGRTDEAQVDAARVLMQAADVYGSAADLEMAQATAREGLTLAVRANNELGIAMNPVTRQSIALAADVELAVLTATGQTVEAAHSAGLLDSLGVVPPLPTLTRKRLADPRRRADQGGVRSAIRQFDLMTNGPPQLAGIQLAPEPLPLVAPALRVPREVLPVAATIAAEAAIQMLSKEVAVAYALGLEAHWMLVHLIQEAQELTRSTGLLHVDVPHWSGVWVDLLGPLTRWAQAIGDDDMGRDLAGWGLTSLRGVLMADLPPERQDQMREAARYFEEYRAS